MSDRHLQLVVNEQTGEVEQVRTKPTYEELEAKLDRQATDLQAWHARCRNLERQLADLHETEPAAGDVREVLEYWRVRVMPAAKLRPGSERWIKTKARLKEGFTVEDLRLAVDGALASDFHRQKQEWLDAKSVFGSLEKVESHMARGKEHLRSLPCHCGHTTMDHLMAPVDPARRCKECGCLGYSDVYERARRVLAARRAKRLAATEEAA
jgi:hypothetical protein